MRVSVFADYWHGNRRREVRYFDENATYESARKLSTAFNFEMRSDYRKFGKPVAIKERKRKLAEIRIVR